MQQQRKYVKIDGSTSSEPPRDPRGDQPQSLTDRFASFATASYRRVTCNDLRQAFNDLRKNPELTNENGTPLTVQLLMAFQKVEEQVTDLTKVIEAGGLASVKAARAARNILVEGLDKMVIKHLNHA